MDREAAGGRPDRRWDAPPADVCRVVEAYLVDQHRCLVRSHRAGFQLVSLTAGTRSTVRVFLSALKLFYRVMRMRGAYAFANPLEDSVRLATARAEERSDDDEPWPRMPEISGVVAPRRPRRLSDSYVKLVRSTWVPRVVDDPTLPARVLAGGRALPCWGLREECVTRLLFESGGRVSEVTGLTLGDWLRRGLLQEATAFSKGSHGRRVKFLRFSSDTAKLLRRYVDGDRRRLDPRHLTCAVLLEPASRHEPDLSAAPLFLTARRTRLTPKHYRDNAWTPACAAAGIDADVHQARHWYVTMAVRQIYETATTDAEVKRRMRELSGRASVASLASPVMADVELHPWQRLAGKIAPEVLHAPELGGDVQVHERVVSYLERSVVGAPWADSLALVAVVMTARRRDVSTVRRVIQVLHPRLSLLFTALGLTAIADWHADHLLAYLRGEVRPTDRQTVRSDFWKCYATAMRQLTRWLATLPVTERERYRRFVLPVAPAEQVEGLVKQRQARKAETAH